MLDLAQQRPHDALGVVIYVEELTEGGARVPARRLELDCVLRVPLEKPDLCLVQAIILRGSKLLKVDPF